MGNRFDELFLPSTKDDLFKLSKMYSESSLVPDCYRGKAADIVIAWSLGMPLGLSMMQCLLGIAVVNGRPTLWGDVLNGLILSQPDLESLDEVWNEGDQMWACTIKRKNRQPVIRTFSMSDAKTAKLYPAKETAAWTKYPKRMIQMRARGFCIRDSYADRLCGLGIEPGEIIDITENAKIVDEKSKISITDKIAAKLSGVTEPSPPEESQQTPDISEPTSPDTPEYKDIQEVVNAFREAADVETLKDMQCLIGEVEPAYRQEAKQALDRAFEDLNQENTGSPTINKTPDEPEEKDDALMRKLSRICVGINSDDKAGIAKELFNDGRKTKFRVRDLDNNQLLKLKGILESRNMFQEDE